MTLRPFLLALALAIAQVAMLSSNAVAQEGALEPPDRIVAIGDSITRATNVCCWYGDHPRHSWSTGGAPFDGIRSHYERIRSADPSIHGRNVNVAVAGARMRHAPGQAATAVSRGAEYVTILMGANDACRSSAATMTSVEDFRSQFQETMTVLTTGLPRARIFVASIPNAKHVVYDPISVSAILDAHQITHGTRMLPHYRFDRADVIVSLDDDNYLRGGDYLKSHAHVGEVCETLEVSSDDGWVNVCEWLATSPPRRFSPRSSTSSPP